MKKVLMLAGVLTVAVSSFALNAVAPAGALCQPGKKAFEQLKGENAVAETVKLAASLEKMTDFQAIPAAVCYATYQVEGQSLVDFARANANNYRHVVAKQLKNFASRVETLSQQAAEDVCRPGKEAFEAEVADLDVEDFRIIQSILRLADSLEGLSAAPALPVTACYATYQVNDKPLATFIQENNGQFRNVVNKQLASFQKQLTEVK